MIKKQKRVSTILGFLIVLTSIGGTAFLVENFQNVSTQAQPSIIPQEVKITNLTSSSLTVSWVTAEKAQGFIVFGEEKALEQTAFDERDKEGNFEKYLTHHIQIKNLKPDLTYYFKIISQGKNFDQNGFPYEARTAPALSCSLPQIEPAYGTVLNKNNTPAQGTIVYLNFEGTLPLSALTKSSGNFLIPLNLTLNSDLKSCFTPEEELKEEIIARANINDIATAITNTNNDSPIPTMILGKSYDFRSQKGNNYLTQKELPQEVLGAKNTSKEIKILFPNENSSLLDTKPLFKGKGVPGKEIIIKIESPIFLEKTTVDANGQWFFRPNESIPPGKHKLTITTKNEQGEEETLTRNFLVLESGRGQALGDATPSATLAPSPSPSPTLTITPVPTSSSATPSAAPSPSLTPGIFALTINFLSIGVFFLLIGIGLFFIFPQA